MSTRYPLLRSSSALNVRSISCFLSVLVVAVVLLPATIAHGQARQGVNSIQLEGYVGPPPEGQREMADLTLRAGQKELRFQVTNLTTVTGNASASQFFSSIRPHRPNLVLLGAQELLTQVDGTPPGGRLRLRGAWRTASQEFALSSVEAQAPGSPPAAP